jgi:hypothetical protein
MPLSEWFTKLDWYPLKDFGAFFGSFRETAFRLELLPVFSVPEEKEYFNRFLTDPTQPPPTEFNQKWLNCLGEAKSKGKEFIRIRVVDGEPTSYLKFEIQWAYSRSILEGENVRFILRDEPVPFHCDVPALKDFWLFDNEIGFLMEYDYLGRFFGVKKIPDPNLESYLSLKEELLNSSSDFDIGAKTLGV